MLTLSFSFLASRGSSIGGLLEQMGIPHWILWVLLGGWICFTLYRKFARTD
ncbi:MAG: hypothetical protein V4819_15640 [Verrucomicrobiota bacterium]